MYLFIFQYFACIVCSSIGFLICYCALVKKLKKEILSWKWCNQRFETLKIDFFYINIIIYFFYDFLTKYSSTFNSIYTEQFPKAWHQGIAGAIASPTKSSISATWFQGYIHDHCVVIFAPLLVLTTHSFVFSAARGCVCF